MLNTALYDKKVEYKSTRQGFGDALVELGKQNPNVVVLTADLKDSTKVNQFAEKFPKRFFDVGVAEQNLAGISTGLALSGKIPFLTSYATFSPGRNWEQLRIACYSNANIKIVSSHAGLSTGADGATHQALEDIALTRVLPNLTVFNPCDYHEAKKATIEAENIKGPVYLRLYRAETPVITTVKSDFNPKLAPILVEGKDITLVSSGPILHEVLLAAKKLLEQNKISCEVINLHTIKPIDKNTLIESVSKTKKLVIIEEHQMHAGIGSTVLEAISEIPVKSKIIGINDTFTMSGTYNELKHKYHLDAESLTKNILDFANN